jgi:hypothetical protein
MTDAKALHRDLMKALLSHLPRTVYGDIRRVVTLAWAVVGLCLTRTVRLTAWAEVVEGRATYAASRGRRFARWLHHAAIDPTKWYPPILKAALRDWTPQARWYVALDTTVLGPFVLIRASLVYRGRAIPLAWKALRHASAMVSFEAYQPLVAQVRTLLPAGSTSTVLADRGFLHEQLIRYTQQHHWHYRIRMLGSTLVQQPHHSVRAVEQLRPAPGHAHFYHNVTIFGTAVGPVHLVVAQPVDAPTTPGILPVMNSPVGKPLMSMACGSILKRPSWTINRVVSRSRRVNVRRPKPWNASFWCWRLPRSTSRASVWKWCGRV